MADALYIIVGGVGVVLVWGIATYNKFISLRERSKNAWSQIDVQLKRRADLIPNLVNTVKGYAQHEKSTLERIAQLRSKIVEGEPGERMAANNLLSRTLKSLFAVVENYPELKANKNFLALQEELASTENRVAYARQAYNDVTYLYNTMLKSFPSNVLGNLLNLDPLPYIEANKKEKEVVNVEL
ncbi:MAG: LemA family protein [Methanobacteriota archaeon]|nr:MAG: LemA family protein [Euryarchaeota archaeon]